MIIIPPPRQGFVVELKCGHGGIYLLRTGELLRWRRDAVEGMELWVSNESHLWGYIRF